MGQSRENAALSRPGRSRSASLKHGLPSVRDVPVLELDTAAAPAVHTDPRITAVPVRADSTPLERWRPSPGAAAAAVAVAAVVLAVVTSSGVLAAAVASLAAAQLGWLAVAAAGTLALWLAGSVSQLGAMPVRPPLGRLLAVQVAASFANHLLPGGIGGNAVNVRFLRTLGVSRATAIGSASLNSLATGITHALLLLATVLVVPAVPAQVLAAARAPQSAGLPAVEAPGGSAYAVGLAVLVVAGAVLLRRWFQRRTSRVDSRLSSRRAEVLHDLRRLVVVARDPRRALQLWLGSTAAGPLHGLVLVAVLQSMTDTVPVLAVVAVYLAASAVSALIPAPGAVGPLDLMLVAGLVAVNVPPAVAVAAVLGYRLVTVWLPLVPSAVVFWQLLHRRII